MAKQIYDTGDVIQAGTNPLEVVGVSYQEVDGEKVGFTYSVRLKSELDAERAAEAERQAAAEAAEKEREKLTPEQVSDEQPAEEGKE